MGNWVGSESVMSESVRVDLVKSSLLWDGDLVRGDLWGVRNV